MTGGDLLLKKLDIAITQVGQKCTTVDGKAPRFPFIHQKEIGREYTSADGTKGHLLKFGHDEDAKPYVYWVAIFLAQSRLFIVEAGGQKELFERAKANVEWTMKNVTVRCNGFLAPVLSSHTCNRW